MVTKKTVRRTAIGIALTLCLLLSSGTVLALQQDSFRVTQVETTQNQVLVHFGTTIPSGNRCTGGFSTIAGCSTSDAYCENVLRIALAAQVSGREVDFDLASGSCVSGQVSSVSKITRIRIHD